MRAEFRPAQRIKLYTCIFSLSRYEVPPTQKFKPPPPPTPTPPQPKSVTVNSKLLFFRTLRPLKPYGLLGTGEEWNKEWERRPTSRFTRLLNSEHWTLKAGLLFKPGGVDVNSFACCSCCPQFCLSNSNSNLFQNRLQTEMEQWRLGDCIERWRFHICRLIFFLPQNNYQ